MNIACLGWGSLVWSPRELPSRGVWQVDGPLLPIEFSRVSSGGLVTLVITKDVVVTRSLWIQLTCTTLEDSVRALAAREGVTSPANGKLPSQIAYWSKSGGATDQAEVEVVASFAERLWLDAVVWTALKPGISKESRGVVPDAKQLVAHLRELPQHAFSKAEAYVRNAPVSIDTPNRRLFAEMFGWEPANIAYSACGLTRACS